MRQTDNLGLALYDASDKMNITGAENSLNHNMELLDDAVSGKQATLVSGTNIKLINGQSILGSGNIKIETSTEDKVPTYVITEADAVIEKVMAAQGSRTFTFAAISDLHYGCGGYTDGVKHACQALAYINARIKLDAVAVLGDYTDGRPGTAGQTEDSILDMRIVNSLLNGLRQSPNLRIQGNHDYWDGHVPEIFRYIQAYSDDVVFGDPIAGYFYKDFDRCKLRIICINTAELSDKSSVTYSEKQAQWYANALDLSGKADAAEWQILILSHMPVDFWYTDNKTNIFSALANAYKNGAAYTSGNISYDYAGKNRARLIGNIHGHIHNFLVDRIYVDGSSSTDKAEILRIATPEACYGRPNGYDGIWQEGTTYNKVINTSYDTSFVIYCIDMDTDTIKAICYGAGYNRTIHYGDALSWESEAKPENPGSGDEGGSDEPVTPTYTNWIPIATDESGNTVTNGAMYTNKRWNGEGVVTDVDGHFITGFIPVKIGDMIRIRWNNHYTLSSGYIALRSYNSAKQPLAARFPFNQMNTAEYEGLNFINSAGYQFDYENGIVDFTLPETGYTPAGTAYLAFCLGGDPSEAIITVNEAIE